jgi:arabinofuranan 3-O-arabinosyltransferase
MRRRLIPLGLAAAAYALALVQRPGTVVADTKVDLHVDPSGFLGDVASAWTATGQLGHVFGGQYGGYLFPMAPWFALGDAAGLPEWVVHRLWLGTLLALAAWGVVRLLDAMVDRPRGAPHVAAAVLFVLNPYVAIYANRISVSLLAYAALPWLLLAVHRGLRAPRSWRWPALFALALTCTGGGVNAAVTGWLLLGPLLLVAYERTVGGVPRGAIGPFALRLAPAVALANAWWVVPVLVHARYGLDFLPFTEQPGTIWQTTSVTESLRLMGFWASYIGFGFGGVLRPYASSAPPLLFEPAVVVASLLVPALALGGFAWTRRWRYGPWFLLLTLVGLLVMVAGFPEGTPLRRALTFTYNHVGAVQFLRTTYKAGPLVALGLACLGGAAFGLAWSRLRAAPARAAAAAAGLSLCAVAAWPLTSGTAPERQLAIDVPPWWRDAAREVDRLPGGERAMVLPGQLFAFYDWGGTWDPILPVLAGRPVAERFIVPFSDLRAVELLWATDDLVTQERLLPGQLPPLLDLLGVGLVVTPADRDRSRSGELGPLEAADALALEPGLGGAGRSLGPERVEQPEAGRVRAAEPLPRVRARRVATAGLVRLVPRGPLTVVDGSAQGVAALAGFGGLDPGRPLAYAADLDAEAIRRAARAGGTVVVTDTNRRRAYAAARLRANTGPTLPPDQGVSEDGALLTPFDEARTDAQTVAIVGGVRSVGAPASPQVTQFPEHRPFAALDGDPATAWLADRALTNDRHRLTVRLASPRPVPHVDLLPYDDRHGVLRRILVNGRGVAVRRGWNRVRLGERAAGRVEVRIDDVQQRRGLTGGAGGIRELRIPGVRATETLRPPVLAERALRGPEGRAARLAYLLSRTTVDAPRRAGPPVGPFQSYLPRDRMDPEPRLRRTISPPAARRWRVDAWTSPDPRGDDAALDRLAGAARDAAARSSGRYRGLAAHRASGAFDGTRDFAWIGPWLDRTEWLALRRGEPFTVRRLRLAPPRDVVRRPAVVRVRMDGEATGRLRVGSGGSVPLARPLRGRELTIEVLDARFPPGTPGRVRQRRAVGIGEVEGLPRMRVPRRGPLRGSCGDGGVTVGPTRVALRARGDVAALDRGAPLRAAGCADAALPAGRQGVLGGAGALRVDHLRLAALEPEGNGGAASGADAAGRVLDPGEPGRGEREGIRLDVRRPAWLVLGESFNAGWRATCDGRDLGEPVPLQGYANAWPVDPGCRTVDVAWAPNRLLPWAYLLSLVACLGLLALAVRGGGRALVAAAPAPLPDDPRPRRLEPRRAILAGLAAGAVLGFVFALRAGLVIAPAVAFVLWRGWPARRLALAGGGLLLVVVPILYLAVPARDPGGYNSNLAVERIAAHWVGVAAVVLLGMALWRTVQAARSRP